MRLYLKKYCLYILFCIISNSVYAQRVALEPQPVLVPSGFVETKNIQFFKTDDQGSNTTVDKVIADYNKYIVGKYAGKDVPAVTKDDITDKNGNPLDWNLHMDIIHPEVPTTPRPVIVIIATQPIRNIPTYTPFQQKFANRGYVTVVIDHAFSPLVEAFKYDGAYYSLDDVTGVKVYTAAIRYLRANAAQYSIDPDRIGGFGHSKGAYGITRLSDPSINHESNEHRGDIAPYGPQPNIEYPSHIQVGYQTMGNGTRRSKQYVTDDYAPTVSAVGYYDQYDQWSVWPTVVEAYTAKDANWLGIPMLDKGHDMAAGFQPDLGYVREDAVEKFFINYLEPNTPPNVLYVSPYNGLDNSNIVLNTSSVAIHFSPQINVSSVNSGVSVIDLENNQPVAGEWKALRKDTYFEFTPTNGFQKDKSYKVIIGTNVKSVNNINISEPVEHVFTVNAHSGPGSWNGQESNWNYNFTGTQSLPEAVEGLTITETSLSANDKNESLTTTSNGISNSDGWLPRPTSAIGFIRISGSVNTSYNILDNNGKKSLKIGLAGTVTTPNKFSVYNIANATPVAKFAMKLNFSQEGNNITNGSIRFVIGNNSYSNNVFTNGSNVNMATYACYFTALRWLYSSSGIDFGYRKKTTSAEAVWESISNTAFSKDGGEYELEIYANNSSVKNYYTKGGIEYEISSSSFHVWLGDERIGTEYKPNTSSTKELPVDTKIDALLFNHTQFTPANSAYLTLSDLNVSYVSSKALPVKLTSFNGKLQGSEVGLNWVTVSEKNNSHFDVLRSSNGKQFTKIGRVNGVGTSAIVNYYNYSDKSPFRGINYYKLNQVDFDGKSEESKVISVKVLVNEQDVKVYQQGNATIAEVYSATEASKNISVSDITGKTIYSKNVSLAAGKNQFEIDLSKAPNGVYVLAVDRERSVKFLK